MIDTWSNDANHAQAERVGSREIGRTMPVWECFAMTQGCSPKTPDAYLIDVQGDLTSWKGRLGELKMHIEKDPHYGQVTTLKGPVRDQAELFGILNTIYELHLPLLRLKKLKAPKQAKETA